MKKYSVRITDDALKDMEDIYHYIAYELQSLDRDAKVIWQKRGNENRRTGRQESRKDRTGIEKTGD
ncbi:MAG: hypothetical protein Q4B73_08075 [Lachnospiraceae bacterium]|nr:hypothetical protein [Lachnospiraceae bacterium]